MILYSSGHLWIWTVVKLLRETQLRKIQLSLYHYLHYALPVNICFNSSLYGFKCTDQKLKKELIWKGQVLPVLLLKFTKCTLQVISEATWQIS